MNPAAPRLLAVYTTVADEATARRLAEAVLQAGLAACVQFEPIRSLYRWQGALQDEAELRLMFKTTAAHYPALEALLREQHPYELPAIHAVAVAHASPAYAQWVAESTLAPAAAQPRPPSGELQEPPPE